MSALRTTAGRFGWLLVLAWVLGCESGPKLPPMERVSGTVTLDGKPVTRGLVQFQPGPASPTAPDRPIETLNQGQNCVTAFVWDQLEGQATAEPVAWCFNAT